MKKLLLAGIASILSVAAAQALPVGPGTVISNGGATFSNFTCATTAIGGTFGNCGTLSVVAFGASGIEFQGQIQALAGSASSLDILIGYNVARTNPPISSVGLTFNGLVTGTGVATAQITETAFNTLGGTLLGQTFVANPSPLQSSLTISPALTSIYLTKDIVVSALPGLTGITTATISFIDQSFPGGGTPIPEPVSLALLGVGLVGLGLVRQTKRS